MRSVLERALRDVGEAHHKAFKSVDGQDSEWAVWYSDWLISHIDILDVLPGIGTSDELVDILERLDREFAAEDRGESWEVFYARNILMLKE